MPDTQVKLDPLFDVQMSVSTGSVRHLVLVLHGMWDKSSTWATTLHVSARFQDIDITVRPVSYELIGPLILFSGFGRKKRNEKVIERLQYALSRGDYDKYTLICHSNGTKLFSEVAEYFHDKIDHLFLCGSICHIDDDVKFRKFKNYVINDCGLNDFWPILASLLRPFTFGDTGVSGFGNEPIVDRFYRYGHSDATKPEHFSENIIPVLTTGKVGITKLVPNKRRILARRIMTWALASLVIVVVIGCWLF